MRYTLLKQNFQIISFHPPFPKHWIQLHDCTCNFPIINYSFYFPGSRLIKPNDGLCHVSETIQINASSRKCTPVPPDLFVMRNKKVTAIQRQERLAAIMQPSLILHFDIYRGGINYNSVGSLLWRKNISMHYLVFPIICMLRYPEIVNKSHLIQMFLV